MRKSSDLGAPQHSVAAHSSSLSRSSREGTACVPAHKGVCRGMPKCTCENRVTAPREPRSPQRPGQESCPGPLPEEAWCCPNQKQL